ncbi:MAG TPA: ABC transporter permease [Hyphomicrobiales bacterium]|nr:ABC transporter permease [Hyphomicrobiales bacterium]
MTKIARDTWLMFQRSLMLSLRNPLWVFIGLLQPVIYLALFAPLLQKVVQIPGFPPGGAFNVFVPGLLIQLGLFGAAFVGFGLLAELRAGVVERMRVTPVSRFAMLLGRALRDVVMLVVQAAVLIALAVPFGLTVNAVGVVVALCLLALVGLVMAPLSYAVALWLGSEDALAPFLNMVSLPLLLLSGVLLPMSLAPDWLQTLAKINPLSHAVSAMRALFNADFANGEIAWGVGLMAVLAALSLWIAGRAFGRSQV